MNPSAAITINNLHKTFGDNEVLKGVSLTAHQGDVVSILGSSGSGKSTLLRCINLLEIPTSGQIARLENFYQTGSDELAELAKLFEKNLNS